MITAIRSRSSIATALVDRAKRLAEEMIEREAHLAQCDTDTAMRNLEDKTGVAYRTLWTLKYRPPKDLYGSIAIQIEAAHEAMKHEAGRRYSDRRQNITAENWVSARLLRVADLVAGEAGELPGAQGGATNSA